MARKKRVLRIRREGKVVSETKRPIRKSRTVKVKAKRWDQMSLSEKRASVPCPTRKDLTMAQWREWGDGLRVLRRYEYENADTLSLAEMRDAVRSIELCSQLRFISQ
ncbi:MAG: hypothetical protein DRJ03_23520 [Chloroflexi bacterium]|nr:MAG: hypothetical protein DRJ03_23520 [Chloroflexota bacterium]